VDPKTVFSIIDTFFVFVGAHGMRPTMLQSAMLIFLTRKDVRTHFDNGHCTTTQNLVLQYLRQKPFSREIGCNNL
jgi:hypothetical protein